MTSDLHVPFETAYRRPHVPKGCHVPRDEYPRAAGIASVRQISREDASVAFSITHPASGSRRFAMLSASERTIDILSFAGKLWWPHGHATFRDLGNCVAISHYWQSADEWRDDIRETRDLLTVVPTGDRIVDTKSFSRFELSDEHDLTIAKVQRILQENFIICDGVVHAAGGVPVHALWRCPGYGQMEVVNSGADRTVTGFEPPYGYPGLVHRTETQEAFSEARFWPPGKLQPPELRRSQRAFAEIEVRDQTLVPDDLADRVAIDALFRRTKRSLGWFMFHTLLPDGPQGLHFQDPVKKQRFRSETLKTFENATVPAEDDDFATSVKRLAALRALFVGRREVPKKWLRMVDALEKAFRTLDRRNQPEEFAPEDLAALDNLAD